MAETPPRLRSGSARSEDELLDEEIAARAERTPEVAATQGGYQRSYTVSGTSLDALRRAIERGRTYLDEAIPKSVPPTPDKPGEDKSPGRFLNVFEGEAPHTAQEVAESDALDAARWEISAAPGTAEEFATEEAEDRAAERRNAASSVISAAEADFSARRPLTQEERRQNAAARYRKRQNEAALVIAVAEAQAAAADRLDAAAAREGARMAQDRRDMVSDAEMHETRLKGKQAQLANKRNIEAQKAAILLFYDAISGEVLPDSVVDALTPQELGVMARKVYRFLDVPFKISRAPRAPAAAAPAKKVTRRRRTKKTKEPEESEEEREFKKAELRPRRKIAKKKVVKEKKTAKRRAPAVVVVEEVVEVVKKKRGRPPKKVTFAEDKEEKKSAKKHRGKKKEKKVVKKAVKGKSGKKKAVKKTVTKRTRRV